MCEKCEDFEKQIALYNRFLKQNFDALTLERLKAGLTELEKRKAELH
jgi:hypothetical protein